MRDKILTHTHKHTPAHTHTHTLSLSLSLSFSLSFCLHLFLYLFPSLFLSFSFYLSLPLRVFILFLMFSKVFGPVFCTNLNLKTILEEKTIDQNFNFIFWSIGTKNSAQTFSMFFTRASCCKIELCIQWIYASH